MIVSDRSPSLTVHDRFLSVFDRFLSVFDRFMSVFDRFMIENTRKRSLNGQEHLGTIESERSNALERIVENGHVHVPKTKETL